MLSQEFGQDMVGSHEPVMPHRLKANCLAEFGKEKTVPLSGKSEHVRFDGALG